MKIASVSAAVRVWVLGTGSSGNAALIESEGERLLVDAGIGPKRAVEVLRMMGVDLFPRSVLGVVVSHEHDDHAAKLEPLVRALRAPACLHDGMVASRVRAQFPVVSFDRDGSFELGPFKVSARTVPHDAPQVALRVDAGGAGFGWLTDIGHVPASLPFFFEGCQTVLVEANYDAELLAFGPYSPRLRARVGGPFGHLDNHDTGRLVAGLERLGVERVKLAHLSAVNNTPEKAFKTVRARAGRMALDVLPHGMAAAFEVARKPKAAQQLRLF